VAARVTASVAAEIATMRGTGQIDALVTLSTKPMKYRVVRRRLAGLITVPVLVAVGDGIGIFGGYTVSVQNLGFNAAAYLKNTVDFLEARDIISSLVKGAAFGVIATLMGCYHGMKSDRGAQGVGKATKNSVEAAAVLILAANFVLTGVFFSI
ncbi:MAG: MlaE family ABC transporter permease, partial [Arenibacterium sp.]